MHKIEAKRLWLDTVGLYEEYQKDNKRIYENLYKTYFYETDGYNFLREFGISNIRKEPTDKNLRMTH